MPRQRHRRSDPKIVSHLAQWVERAAQAPSDAIDIARTQLWLAQPERLDIKDAKPSLGQLAGDVLLVGPKRMIPIGCGKEHDIAGNGSIRPHGLVLSIGLGSEDRTPRGTLRCKAAQRRRATRWWRHAV